MKTINKKQNFLGLMLLPMVIGTTLYADMSEMENPGNLGNPNSTYAYAISADGSVVVGTSTNSDSNNRGFRWTSAGGMVDLGTLGGSSSYAYGTSDDGSVIVGSSYTAGGNRYAYRWESNVMTSLGVLAGGAGSGASAVSGDGLTVVGSSGSTNGGASYESFYWTLADGMVSLGTLTGALYKSSAEGVSNDGSVIVGRARNATNSNEAYRWTSGTGMVGLGFLPGGSSWSGAYAVSSDGTVVVGHSQNSDNMTEAFRWENNIMTGLGILSGAAATYAKGVSSDGTVVVGHTEDFGGDYDKAFRWTASTGMQSLSEWLGINLNGWSEMTALDVSDDGNIVVGYGRTSTGTDAFIARGGSGVIATTAFAQSLQSAGTVASQGVSTASTIMHGAHGHPGAKRALDDKRSMWVAGDIGHDDRHDSSDDFQIAEIGVSYHYNENLAFSVALGKTWGKSTLLYDGSSKSQGKYIAIDTDIKLPTTLPLYATVTLLHAQSDISIKRGYDNAGSNDASYADTQQSINAIRARLQYQDAKTLNALSIHPYVEYNLARITTDAYTETGGGFPSQYNKSKESIHDWRFGADANYVINESNRIITTLEGIHRMDEQGNGISGQIVGLSSFSMAGRDYDQTWTRATLGIEHKLSKGKVTLTLNSSTEGEDPQYWSGLNYTVAF